MSFWTQQFINALTIGGMYTLIAIGYSLFFGVLRFVNFAHSEVFMLGAFGALIAFRACGAVGIDDVWIIIPCLLVGGALTSGMAGFLLERFAFRPLRGKAPLLLLVTSLAAGIVLREGVKEFFPEGASPHPLRLTQGAMQYTLGGVSFDLLQIALIIFSFAAALAVHFIIRKTWFGRGIRALSEDTEAAQMMGVDVNAMVRKAFLFGSVLGGLSGVLHAVYYTSVRFDMGWSLGLKGFTAAVIGGLGNVYGALAGGYVLAFVEVLVVALVPQGSQYRDLFVFALLIIAMLVRPTGLVRGARTKVG